MNSEIKIHKPADSQPYISKKIYLKPGRSQESLKVLNFYGGKALGAAALAAWGREKT
ncbi:MAG: hypothetical protein ACO1NZ_08790 [Adhaeribacter sp.]